ncbi:uncharacterized protein LOC131157727 [Malania oleifera]|uniref:uncharacterized protein LOC131157727 n=1 Tax=Malania oleifera TaxID=397392 RepID=UPI0025ADFC8A|nr:uncharacterized protein LOC131157727 [Malania oleifera]
MRPPSFSGGADFLAAENWVQDIEDMLPVLKCTNEQKVVFVMFKLRGEARCWWRSARLIKEQILDLVPVMWSRFKELFFERYFPTIIWSAKAAEFMHLSQGQITVSQYVARFIELSQFVPHMALGEEKKVRKFEEGMRKNLFEQVIGFWAQTFADVVDRATVIESGMQKGTTAQSQRNRPMPQGFQAGFSRGPWRGDCYSGGQRQMMGPCGNLGVLTYPMCQTCGRKHLREC